MTILSGSPNWAEVGQLVTQIAAFFAAAAAFFAVRRQISAGERQHREQLHASARPLILIREVRINGPFSGSSTAITVSNIGIGPAPSIEIRAWPRSLPSPSVNMPEWDERPYLDETASQVDLDAPELIQRVGGIGAGETATHMVTDEHPALTYEGEEAAAFLVYMLIFQDVFGNTFPATPPNEWRAEHIIIERSQ